jgi:hypothetical protein
MTPQDLHLEATRLGLRLEPAGVDKLAIFPKGKCPPEFAAVLRRHKGELLAWLRAETNKPAPDCPTWRYVARQVLAGEFDAADHSTVASLTIGLRSVSHPICQQALARLSTKSRNSTPP